MATPTTLPNSFSVGATLTSAQMNDLRGAFRIMQVVQGSHATQVSSTSGTYVDTGLSATITPRFTSSLILVVYSMNVYTFGATTGMGIQLVRQLPSPNTILRRDVDLNYGTNSGTLSQNTFIYLDNPGTTSSLTYKTQFNRSFGASTVFLQANSANGASNILLLEVSA